MIAIVTDSTCDLPKDILQQRHIHVVPQHIIWEGKSFLDGIDLTGEAFYQRLSIAHEMPRTSQPVPADFVKAYQQARAANHADEVLAIVITQKASGSYASAIEAAKEVDFKVRVVDSRLLSIGLGLLVLRAADLIEAGAKLEDIPAALETYIPNINVFFTVATLDFLHRGGRIGKAKHLVGKALQIKPILYISDGQVASFESVRTRSRALNRLAELAREKLAPLAIKRLAVMDGQAKAEGDQLVDELCRVLQPQYFYRGTVCSAVGTHAGPGVIGIAYDANG